MIPRLGMGILLALILFAGTLSSGLPRAMLLRHVDQAAHEAGIAPVLLYALWQQECSLRSVCEAGDEGRSFGPFQIQPDRAREHGCQGNWRQGPAQARCAARIIADELGLTKTVLGAYTRFQCPQCWYRYGRRPTTYAVEVYHRLLLLHLRRS